MHRSSYPYSAAGVHTYVYKISVPSKISYYTMYYMLLLLRVRKAATKVIPLNTFGSFYNVRFIEWNLFR